MNFTYSHLLVEQHTLLLRCVFNLQHSGQFPFQIKNNLTKTTTKLGKLK